MSYTSRQNRTRLAVYAVIIPSQMAYNLILTLTPFVNEALGTTDMQYSLTFAGYYLMVLLSSLCFGTISDRIGRRPSLLLSLLMLVLSHVVMYWTRDVKVYIICRFVAGTFDTIQYLTQAIIADITTLNERPRFLTDLESKVNIAQAIGPIIGGVLSNFNLYLAMWFAVFLYALSFVVAFIWLPESIPSVIEKNKLNKTFTTVNEKQKSLIDYEEAKKIQQEYIAELKRKEQEQLNASKLRMNYLMIVAIIGEFCTRWIFGVFDTVVSLYGLQKYNIQPLIFSLISTIGSFLNTVQTGFLFKQFIKMDISIPMIASLCGIVGMVAMLLCVSGNKSLFMIGAVSLIIAYGFSSPAAPAILSAESSELTQGKALSYNVIGGYSAYILGPLVLNNIYTYDHNRPFYISLIPCIVMFVMMIITHYAPGGKLAGQVALADSLENARNRRIADLELTEDTKRELKLI